MNLSPTTDLLFSHKNRIHYRQENKIIFQRNTIFVDNENKHTIHTTNLPAAMLLRM